MATVLPLQAHPPEEVLNLDDPATGLSGLIVLHSTRLGPAAGGCRLWHYVDHAAAASDALRLAEGMSYKNALAGLPLGGGKAVLNFPMKTFSRSALFAAFGRAVEALDGRYVTAEDVGTSVADMTQVRTQTAHVAGLAAAAGAPGGDPSPWTALGVFKAMEVAVERRLNKPLSQTSVAIQGLGNVGFALAELLHAAGAKLVVSELRSDVAARAAVRFGADVKSSAALLTADVDVFAPCALGGVLTDGAVNRLQAKVVCGGANNQLATPEQGPQLAGRDILYAPDYVVNAGGIINVAGEHFGWSQKHVEERVGAIGGRLMDIFDRAEADNVATNFASDQLARATIQHGTGQEQRRLAA